MRSARPQERRSARALGLLKPDKAKLVCTDDNLPDGRAVRDRVHVQPDRVPPDPDAQRSAATRRRPRTAARREFAGTNAMTLTMQLFFDDFASPKGDVTPKITTLLSLDEARRRARATGTRRARRSVAVQVGRQPAARRRSRATSRTSSSTTRSSARTGTPVQAKVDITIDGPAGADRRPEPDVALDQQPARPRR